MKSIIKKVLSVLFVMLYLMTTCALAEGNRFSVRNGIEFGISKEEVIAIEKENGNEIDEITSMILQAAGAVDTEVAFPHVNVAGYDECTIHYLFDDNGALDGIDYVWSQKFDQTSNVNVQNDITNTYNIYKHQFDTINETLENKYEAIGRITGRNEVSYANFNTDHNYIYAPFDRKEHSSEFDVYGFTQYIANDLDDFVEM